MVTELLKSLIKLTDTNPSLQDPDSRISFNIQLAEDETLRTHPKHQIYKIERKHVQTVQVKFYFDIAFVGSWSF